MIGEKFLTKLISKAAASSLNPLFTGILNTMPIAPYDNLSQAVYDAYCKSDLIYSIVTKKAKAGARAPFGVYRIKSLKAKKEYDKYRKQKNIQYKQLLELKESAIEPIGHYLNDKFQSPNNEMSESEYTESLLTYLNVTGNSYEYLPQEGNRVLQLYSMPAHLLLIKNDGSFPAAVSGYELLNGRIIDFLPEEIIHARYNNPRWTIDGRQLYGMSPIEVLWNLIQGDEEGFDALAEQRKNRGARKLVGIQNDKITNYLEGQKMMDGLKENFNQRQRDYKDRTMPIWGNITVADMGLSGDALDMSNSTSLTFQRACNVFGVPHQWYNTTTESKYNNLEQYNRQAIINGVLPDLNKLRDARNRWARKYAKIKDSELIDYDESVFTELAVDKGAIWTWLKDAPYTADEKRIWLGDEPLKEEGMDKVLVNNTLVPIEMAGKIQNNNSSNNGQENNSQGSSANQEEEASGN